MYKTATLFSLRKLAIGVAVLSSLFILLSSDKTSAISSPFPNATVNYSGNDQCLSTKAGNFNLVVMVRVIDHNGNTVKYSQSFDFTIQSYNKFKYNGKQRKDLSNANKKEWDAYETYKQNSIIYRENGAATSKGPGPVWMPVRVNNAAGTDSRKMFQNGMGNVCKFPGDGFQPAYAFRDGDETANSCFPIVPAGVRTGCAKNGSPTQKGPDNNSSFLLSCLASDATAYFINGVTIFDASGGSWAGVDIENTTNVASPADGANSVRLQSTGGAELNVNDARVVFKYRLPAPPPPSVMTPIVSLSGGSSSQIEVGDSATPAATIANSQAYGSVGWDWDFWYDDNNDGVYQVGETAIASQKSGTHTGPTAGLSGHVATTVDGSKRRICTRLALRNPGANTNIQPPGFAVICKVIVTKPFTSVRNGDVNATLDMQQYLNSSGATCQASGGHVTGFTRGTDRGAGTDLATYAGGTITDFLSAALRTATPARPKGLAFANTDASRPHGGAFGAVVGCAEYDNDWVQATSKPASSVTVSGGYTGPQTIYVNGNVHITAMNVVFPGSFDTDSVPSFKVVATGNIYIDRSVSRIDGTYMAKGTIYTCTNGASAPIPSNLTDGSMWSNCNNTLEVNGSLIAPQVKFLRMAGSAYISSPAETITYNPIVWLQLLGGGGSGPSPSEFEFDAYTTLPPVL